MPLRLESSSRQVEDAAVGRLRDRARAAAPALPSSVRSSNASAAIRDATSPACAPPIPSATANSGGARVVRVLVRAALATGVGARGLVDDPQHSAHSARTGTRCRRCGSRRSGAAPAGRRAAVRSRTCRWSSSCPRCRRRRHGRTAARGGRTRTCRRCRCRLRRPARCRGPGRCRTRRRSPAPRRARRPAARSTAARRSTPARSSAPYESAAGRPRSRRALRATHSRNR